jgi:exopolysaccharide production protein ExoQ
VKRAASQYPLQTLIFFVLFAGLFIIAEQSSPFNPVRVEEWNADYLVMVREGAVQRRVAYLLLAAVTAVLAIMVNRIHDSKIHRGGAIVIGLFMAWAGSSALWSDEPGVLIRRLFVLGIALSWVYVCSVRWSGLVLILFIVFSSLTNVIVCISTELLNGRFTPLGADYRLSGTLAPNELGVNSMVLVLAALTAATMSYKWRYLLLGCAGSGLLAIILTKSRTSLIAVLVGTVVIIHLTVRTKVKLALLWMLVCTGLAVAIYTGPDILQFATSIVPRGTEDVASLDSRVPMWQDCFENYALKSPILGFGYTTFWTPNRISKVSDDAGWGVAAAHSAYLELLLDLGFPGLVLYIILATMALLIIRERLAQGRDRHLIFCGSLICGLLIIGVTESELPFRTSAIYFYDLVGFLLPFVMTHEKGRLSQCCT